MPFFYMQKAVKFLPPKNAGALPVALGGAVGALLRHCVCSGMASQMAAVFLCNALGSFAFSLGVELRRRYGGAAGKMVSAGFCGGVSVFASFSRDSVAALKNGDYFLFAANLSANFAVCIFAAYLAEKLLGWWFWRRHARAGKGGGPWRF